MSNQKGFTLVELLLAMGILSILMTILTKVFLDIVEMRLQAEAESAISQDTRFVYSRLAYDINRATTISAPANPGEAGSSLQLVIGGVTYTYAIDGSDNLMVDDGSGAVAMNSIGTKVTGATFTHRGGVTGAQSVTIDLTLQATLQRPQGPLTRTIKTTIGTR